MSTDTTHTTDALPTTDATCTDLTLFQVYALGVANNLKKPYGLGIKRALEALYGDEVNHGRLYPNLDDLAEKGLVEKSELDARTNLYEVTPAGERVLAQHADLIEEFRGDADADADDEEEEEEEELLFECQWEVGVCEAGAPDDWEHYGPWARTESAAREEALKMASDDFTDPTVYDVFGPMKPDDIDKARVAEEVIEREFGENDA